MPAIRDQKVHKSAHFLVESITVPLITAVSQTNLTFYSLTPGYKFVVVGVKTFCSALVATVSGNLLVGGRTAAPLVFTAATEVAGVLSTTPANTHGSQTEAITIQYTTGASGALTNGSVTFQFRFRPVSGEQGPVLGLI